MFEDLSYKKKFFGLLIVACILAIVSYKRSFKLALDTKKSVIELSEKLSLINGSNDDVRVLSDKIYALDKLIGKEVEPELVPHLLIDYISGFKSVTIDRLEEMHFAKDNSFVIYTNQLVLEGSYNDLIKVIYSFEKEFDTSRVISIKFYSKKDLRKRKKQLFVRLIFQNYEKTI